MQLTPYKVHVFFELKKIFDLITDLVISSNHYNNVKNLPSQFYLVSFIFTPQFNDKYVSLFFPLSFSKDNRFESNYL